MIYYTAHGTIPTTGPFTIRTFETEIAIAASPAHTTSNASAEAYTIPDEART